MNALQVLLKIPFAPKSLVTQRAQNFLFHATFVIHVPQHNTSCRVPFSAFLAGHITRIVIGAKFKQSNLLFDFIREIGTTRIIGHVTAIRSSVSSVITGSITALLTIVSIVRTVVLIRVMS